MLRGIFMPPGVTPGPGAVLRRPVQEGDGDAEWKALMEEGAFNTTTLTGKEYADWVAKEEARHMALMKAAGFIAGQ
jgi:tripartite-type tricarboxylate transporter receptor subunit TctC